MNAIIKNVLGAALVITVLGFTYAATQYAGVYQKAVDPASFRSFSVSGDGKAVAIPDNAQFSFMVITEGGKQVGALQQENTTKVNKAILFVKSKSIDEKDVKTQSYNVQPRYQYFNCPRDGGACPPPEIVGYTVTQSVLVKVRDFAKIGDLLSGVVQSGANSVSDLSFTLDDPTMVQNEARAEAIAKAKAKAESLAKAGGFKLGKLLSIEEGAVGRPPVYYSMEAAKYGMGGGGVAPAPSIEPGSQEMNVSVTLKYEIR